MQILHDWLVLVGTISAVYLIIFGSIAFGAWVGSKWNKS